MSLNSRRVSHVPLSVNANYLITNYADDKIQVP